MEDGTRISAELLRMSGDLRVTIGRIARRIKQLYEAGEVTFSETSVLSRLERSGPATPGDLAEAEHVRPQAIVAIVNSLESHGLVARSPDPSDGRKVSISLTDEGCQVLAAKGIVLTQRMALALAEEFSPEEQRQLSEALPLLERLARSI